MISVDIPGFRRLRLEYAVLDYNGTLATQGVLIDGVAGRIERLARLLSVHVVTADSHGDCAEHLSGLPVALHVLKPGPEDQGKLELVRELGRESCVAVGNGRNDRLMLEAAELGICVLGPECCASSAAGRADVVAPGILPALDLIMDEMRMLATLRT